MHHLPRSGQGHGFATRVIHAGQSPDPSTGAVIPPIYATSTYVQQSPGVHKGLDYGRSHNPTRWAFERCIADLESGAQAFAFASGLAAIATVLETLDSGAHVIAGDVTQIICKGFVLYWSERRIVQSAALDDPCPSRLFRPRRSASPGSTNLPALTVRYIS